MTYESAKATCEKLYKSHGAATKYLKEVSGAEKTALGLTPCNIRQTNQWKIAHNAERAAFAALREFNGYMTKNYSKEMRADREDAMSAKFANASPQEILETSEEVA